MGHLAGGDTYERLRKRLDMHPIGAPDGGPIHEILRMIFPGELADFATRLPLAFFTARKAAGRTGTTVAEAETLLDRLADRGIVLDFERRGTRTYVMSPTYTGFIEFMFMRVRTDVDQKGLAELLEEYEGVPDCGESVFSGPTQFGRTLVHENRIPADVAVEVLDYEKAGAVLRDAKAVAVGMCFCRHAAEHLGRSCGREVHVCMSLGVAAAALERHGLAKQVPRPEALDILARCRAAGLVQIADNARNRPAYICNCCGCCCGQLRAVKRFGHLHPVHTSNFIAAIDPAKCSGCGLCGEKCPVEAIATAEVAPAQGPGKARKRSSVRDDVCLGCAVCVPACKRGALAMKPRATRVLTPESTFDRLILQALERGKLQNFLFDDPSRVDHRMLGAALGALLRLPRVKKTLAAEQVRSRFVALLLKGTVPTDLRGLFGRT